MGKWCLHASSFIFDRIVIKIAGNQDRRKSSDEFDFGPLVSVAHLCLYSPPHKKWRGIMLYPPKILSPSVSALFPDIDSGEEWFWTANGLN